MLRVIKSVQISGRKRQFPLIVGDISLKVPQKDVSGKGGAEYKQIYGCRNKQQPGKSKQEQTQALHYIQPSNIYQSRGSGTSSVFGASCNLSVKNPLQLVVSFSGG